jgi:hypothetical protein
MNMELPLEWTGAACPQPEIGIENARTIAVDGLIAMHAGPPEHAISGIF